MKRFMLTFVAAAAIAAVVTPVQAQDIPDHLRDLQALRAEYPAQLNQAQAGELMGRLAFRLKAEGFGLLRKDGGNNCPVKGLDVRVSCDWILHAPTGTGCDVLGDGPGPDVTGASVPTWCAGEPADMSRFVMVTEAPLISTTGPASAPTPVPAPAGVTRAELDAAIRVAITQLHTDLWNEVAQADGEIRSRLDRLESRPVFDLAGLGAAIDAALAGYEVNGKTRTDRLGLQHVVQLNITRKK